MSVSRETERFSAYANLVRKWNPKINLVAPNSLSQLRSRHIDDSAQLFEYANPSGNWIDVGSGGGFPGVVLAILGAERNLHVTLVESDQRKAAFLKTVARELQLLNLSVLAKRIEHVDEAGFNFFSARALAPLSNLLPMLTKFVTADGEAWLLKGETWQDEVRVAEEIWDFNLTHFESKTNRDSAVLRLTDVRRR